MHVFKLWMKHRGAEEIERSEIVFINALDAAAETYSDCFIEAFARNELAVWCCRVCGGRTAWMNAQGDMEYGYLPRSEITDAEVWDAISDEIDRLIVLQRPIVERKASLRSLQDGLIRRRHWDQDKQPTV